MPELAIDRLTLHATGLSAADGRRLAERVATRLAELPGDIDGRDRNEPVQASVHPRAGAGLDELASQIAAEIRRQLG
jgi:hypothetical protein